MEGLLLICWLKIGLHTGYCQVLVCHQTNFTISWLILIRMMYHQGCFFFLSYLTDFSYFTLDFCQMRSKIDLLKGGVDVFRYFHWFLFILFYIQNHPCTIYAWKYITHTPCQMSLKPNSPWIKLAHANKLMSYVHVIMTQHTYYSTSQ